jgi:hypothetical protein
MVTYGDLFPYPKITLGDLVYSDIIDESLALESADLYRFGFQPNGPFGKPLQNLNKLIFRIIILIMLNRIFVHKGLCPHNFN